MPILGHCSAYYDKLLDRSIFYHLPIVRPTEFGCQTLVIMEDQDRRFLLAGEEDTFKEKAGNLFSAMSDIQYSPTQDVDGFLKSDPLKDEGQTMFCNARGKKSKSSTALGNRSECDGKSGSSLMPPPRVSMLKRKRGQCIPQHVANPKYTKYTLADVPDQQMTQKSNTAVALAFLQEIEERQNLDNNEDAVPVGGRPIFKKPAHKVAPRTNRDNCPSITLSEHHPADTSQNTQNKLKLKQKSKRENEIKLPHLEYEDEE